jgi:hypothetical protein
MAKGDNYVRPKVPENRAMELQQLAKEMVENTPDYVVENMDFEEQLSIVINGARDAIQEDEDGY